MYNNFIADVRCFNLYYGVFCLFEAGVEAGAETGVEEGEVVTLPSIILIATSTTSFPSFHPRRFGIAWYWTQGVFLKQVHRRSDDSRGSRPDLLM